MHVKPSVWDPAHSRHSVTAAAVAGILCVRNWSVLKTVGARIPLFQVCGENSCPSENPNYFLQISLKDFQYGDLQGFLA